ncbi:MAG: hypothetical protein NVS3B20_19020 [Polyangiales bacterium]
MSNDPHPTAPTAPHRPPTERREFVEAMTHHNGGAFYEAHESWEQIWIDEDDDAHRQFVQGLIQVTSAFHKFFYQKAPGSAGRLLARGLSKLAPYPDDHLGLQLGAFREGAKACQLAFAAIESHPETFAAFDRKRVPALHFAAGRASSQ